MLGCALFFGSALSACTNCAQTTAQSLATKQNFAVVYDEKNSAYAVISNPNIYYYIEMRVNAKEQQQMIDIAHNRLSNEQLQSIINSRAFYVVRNAAILQLAANYFNANKPELAKEALSYFNYPISLKVQKKFFAALNNPTAIFY
ncbi:hypothetical protein [Psittacicella hinzii]|uniref:Lipoprotein n=1 Tax=Psittacicella hinzii TaxID=2028575 RepID=A0A3A1YBD8_9GAMM|nr:hypothetical protein [Psittacicella hinzii]RIY34995.1 hypothetical protein CKF58_07280 [Psittacicella hinzii]